MSVIPGISTDNPITTETETTLSGVLVGDSGKVRAATNADVSLPTFETVAKNLRSLPFSITYSSGRLSSIVYTLPNASTITKTINYAGDKVSSIVLSGATPAGISLTKTFTYTGDNITGVSYS